jgi:CMP-N-acetylneuraminic acid synthetase
MYKNKNILAVVPARGGSKGVPLKNIHILGGKPLIYWTLELLQELEGFIKTFVSTDSKKIIEKVEKKGFKPEVIRPDNLSGDDVKDFEVIEHALTEMEKIDNKKYDIILMLQPTAPLRKKKQIIEILDFIIDNNFDSVWTVTDTDLKFHPVKQLKIEEGLLQYVMKEGNLLPTRQSLYNTYHVNGLAYAFTRDCIKKQKSRMGKKTAPFIIKEKVINIDTLEDFNIAEKYIKNYNLD